MATHANRVVLGQHLGHLPLQHRVSSPLFPPLQTLTKELTNSLIGKKTLTVTLETGSYNLALIEGGIIQMRAITKSLREKQEVGRRYRDELTVTYLFRTKLQKST